VKLRDRDGHARTHASSFHSIVLYCSACLISSYRQHGWLTGGRAGVRRAPVRSRWSRRGAARGLLRAFGAAVRVRAGLVGDALGRGITQRAATWPRRGLCRRRCGGGQLAGGKRARWLCVACPSVPLPGCSGVERPGFLERVSCLFFRRWPLLAGQ
jgi:hypothetical protein